MDKRDPHQFSNSSPNWGKSKTWAYQGMNVHYRLLGNNEGMPMVLIHGFGASCDHWRNNVHFFASNGYKVYGIDLIGFGRSEQPVPQQKKYLENLFWSNQLIAFLEEIVEIKNNNEKAILIGNSLGGLTAITTVALRPDLIKAVIAAPLPDPAFMFPLQFKEPIWYTKIKKLLLRIIFKLISIKALINVITKTKLIDFALQSAYYRSISKDKALKKIVSIPAQRENASKALKAMCLGMAFRPIEIQGPSLLKSIEKSFKKIPILLIWGREDKLIPLLLANKLIKMHPWLKLLVLNNAGHCPHDEVPNYFNQNVLKWLEINLKSA